MWGKFQSSQLRIEVKASADKLKASLLHPSQLSKWLFPLQIKPSNHLRDILQQGDKFAVSLGLVTIDNQVELVTDNCLRLILSQGIDGYQEWSWGDGWVQSRLEGISLLPLNLAQTVNLFRLKEFVREKDEDKSAENNDKQNGSV
jgi:hypothetical protein